MGVVLLGRWANVPPQSTSHNSRSITCTPLYSSSSNLLESSLTSITHIYSQVMARPRPRSTSNVSITNNTRSRPPTTSPQLKRTYVMASDSIYQNNITVLRRRDPSILSIMDFFSHVCLYHYNGVDWEKRGFEGTMFLVEQSVHSPPSFCSPST